jgi:hypothetical protein
MSASLQGKATIQVNRVSDGFQLYRDDKARFSAQTTDTGAHGGVGCDLLEVSVWDKNGALFKSVPASSLQCGNIVIR